MDWAAAVSGHAHVQQHNLRYTVQCDSCGDEYKPVGGPTVYRYQPDGRDVIDRLLRDAGWTVDGDRHICPTCV